MFGIIHIHSVLFFSKINELDAAVCDFSPVRGDMPDIKSQSMSLNEQREQMAAMSTILELYKELLQKDMKTMRNAGKSFVEMDEMMGRGMNIRTP